MKFETKFFLWLVIPFAVFTGVYYFWTDNDAKYGLEPIGVVALVMSTLLFVMIGFYLWATGRKLPDRPEDDPKGEIAQAEGDYGYFVASSWTPLWLGGAATIVFAGLAIGWWVFALGIFLGIPAIILWVYESFSGEHPI